MNLLHKITHVGNYMGAFARSFDYCASRGDGWVKYAVYHGGTQPLKPGRNGTLLGDVMRHSCDADGEWFATYDYGDASALRWFGGFKSRREAAMFLLAAKCERDMPGRAVIRGTEQPLSEAYKGRVIV